MKDERDPHTGHKTTGHEWNGIKELNTPVPKAVWFFIIVTHLFALAYWVLMPAFPLLTTYTKGLLGHDDKEQVRLALQSGADSHAALTQKIISGDYQAILADPEMMKLVEKRGKALFADNCSACHGREGKGQSGFPSLVDDDSLWDGTPQGMEETVRVGINSDHPDTRRSQMLAFGNDQLLQRDDIDSVIAYVRSVANVKDENLKPETIAKGQKVYAANCASCHGENAKGDLKQGVPNLADTVWLYGGESKDIYTTVWHGRIGRMPSWEERLTPEQRKTLVLYLLGRQQEERGKNEKR
ncbi:MAG: cytochrome-c oxidase, cbb3-type subunit III [Alphaproteobacteria bacterium]